jgi:2-alkyl-3-oxoalkanoate reductase
MKILLTGATGFLGFRTLEKLVEEESVAQIIATGRHLLDYRKIIHPKVTYQLGVLENQSFVKEICKDVDVIINTASLSSPWGKKSEFESANLMTQANLISAAKNYGIQKFIYISSPSIYYNGKDRLNVKEADPLPSTFVNEYARTKFEAEKLLAASGVPYINLRPRALIGRGDSIIMPRLIKAYDEGKLKIIGNGDNLVDLTSVANVTEAILLSLKAKDSAWNQSYNITNGEPVLLWDQIIQVLMALERKMTHRKVPFFIANGAAALMEFQSKITNGQEPALTRYGVGTLAKSFTLDITKAQQLLGYQPKMTTEDGIHEFINWFKAHENH